MESNEQAVSSPINRRSILSLVFGVLTVLSFCTSWLPIPFTGLVCVPASLFFGGLALIFGVIALVQIRRQNESGRHFAWGGILISGFVFVCIVCVLAALISLFIFVPGSIPIPPILDKYL